jgi:carboxypeptidase Taq
MTTDPKLAQLKEMFGEIADLDSAASILHWDMQCYMPPGGVEARGNQMATLGRLAHERRTSR